MIHEIKIEIDTIKTKAEFAKKVLAQYFLSMVRKGRQEAKDKIAQEEVELEL